MHGDGYSLMADDVTALMDSLKCEADIVGGAMAPSSHRSRHASQGASEQGLAFAANTATSVRCREEPDLAAYIDRAGREYAAMSATPRITTASSTSREQPNWSDVQLKAIDTPILVVDGDHDEASA